MWKFNVTTGSINITLASFPGQVALWTVGPNSTGVYHLNGVGVASFNWTAPASGSVLLIFQNLLQSSWSLAPVQVSVCDARVWDVSPALVVSFQHN